MCYDSLNNYGLMKYILQAVLKHYISSPEDSMWNLRYGELVTQAYAISNLFTAIIPAIYAG